ncbi:MAG TPA: BON domain-containing protein [Caldimonas sp.]
MTRRFHPHAHLRGLAVVSLATLTLLAGCAPLLVGGAVVGGAMIATDRRTSGSQVDDEVIELKAKGRIGEAFPDDERARVNTTSYNRMVLLTGEVATEADKTTAEQAVARIDNVLSVVNELRVGQPNTFSERTKDAFVTTKVKASLVDAKDVFANSIKVVTHRGVVYLMGRVTEREATRASELARGVSGVVKVVRVFEILTESELANTAVKSVARPASSP